MKEKLILTEEQGRQIVYGDSEEFEKVEDKIVETSRWAILYRMVIKRKSDGKFFADNYRVGATEQQDERPYEYDKPDFKEVFPIEKKVIIYE